MRVHNSRVDRLQLIPGMLLDPQTLQPTGQIGMLGVGSIVSCVGEATHVGRETETGVGLFDLTKSISSSMGTVVAANGDLLHWVASSRDLPTGETTSDVHYVGGTGLMDDATGGFSSTIKETITPAADPMIYRGTFSFAATGTIRYSAPATVRK